MSIRVSLFGFGDVRPPPFGKADRIELALPTPAAPIAVLKAAGFVETDDLLLIVDDVVVLAADWERPQIEDGASLRVMSAIEGG